MVVAINFHPYDHHSAFFLLRLFCSQYVRKTTCSLLSSSSSPSFFCARSPPCCFSSLHKQISIEVRKKNFIGHWIILQVPFTNSWNILNQFQSHHHILQSLCARTIYVSAHTRTRSEVNQYIHLYI